MARNVRFQRSVEGGTCLADESGKDKYIMTKTAWAYIGAVIAAGTALMMMALSSFHSDDPARFCILLVLFLASATVKCEVPGVSGQFSLLFFFILLGSTAMSFGELMLATGLATIVQSTYRMVHRPSWIKAAFNVANLGISASVAFLIIRRQIPALADLPQLACLLLGAAAFYFVNTALVSLAVALAEHGSFSKIWKGWCLGSLVYYIVGALALDANEPLGSAVLLAVVPIILVGTVYYRFRDRLPTFAGFSPKAS